MSQSKSNVETRSCGVWHSQPSRCILYNGVQITVEKEVATADNDEVVEDVPDVPSLTISSKRTVAGATGSRKTSRRK